MTPSRFIGWSLTAIIGSVAAVCVIGALMFGWAFVETLGR